MVDITQGDYGYNLNFTITDSSNAALNLTNNTGITFRMSNTTGDVKHVTGDCTVTVEASGTCYYPLVLGDTDTVGTYEFEVEVTFSGKVITSKSTSTINVLAQLD